jgi:dGTPase
VAYSPETAARVRELKDFLFRNMYRHYRVVRMGDKAGRLLRGLFESYVGEPRQLPPSFQGQLERDGVHRVVCDYIAGMTDRFAVDEYQKLFDPTVRV